MLGAYEEIIFRTFDSSNTMTTESHSALKDVQDPNEDINVDNIWETVKGKDLKGKVKEHSLE